jgi:glycosyltransferase involved in cell wall biosynthesis
VSDWGYLPLLYKAGIMRLKLTDTLIGLRSYVHLLYRRLYWILPVRLRLALLSWGFRHVGFLFFGTARYKEWEICSKYRNVNAAHKGWIPKYYPCPKISSGTFNPKISVIVPNYNHAPYLKKRLESVYSQTYNNTEVILLDDASTDGSRSILEEYAARYPENTRCCFNATNSGSVFRQWKNGFELADGDLIWIAESDDYCTNNLLDELAKYFEDSAVMLAFCRSEFIEGSDSKIIWATEEYLSDLDIDIWSRPFVTSAHWLVSNAWAIKNIIPNVSSTLFRHPGKMELLENQQWYNMRLCGDWAFYLNLIRGGLVAYTPKALNMYRIHPGNTSVDTQKKDVYYEEHELIAGELVSLYRIENRVLERQRANLESHWRSSRAEQPVEALSDLYDIGRIKAFAKSRKPSILMASYAMVAGGGETFPIMLANLLKRTGYAVTFLNCCREMTEPKVRKMLHKDIPLLELERLSFADAVFNDMGIEIVHSHHAWVDVALSNLLEESAHIRHVVTTHGMYETMSKSQLKEILPLLRNRITRFIYTADKNMAPFDTDFLQEKRFTKIDNALDLTPANPVPRKSIGIPEDAFVLCLVSRAIPDKGWEEAIKAVKIASTISRREIHLLLIGEGPEYDRLRPLITDRQIHFLGFQPNIRDYFSTADLGLLPSRFSGESFPLVLIDCLQSNRPMIATRLGEIPGMLNTAAGPAGTILDLENQQIPIDKLAEIIVEYLHDREMYLEHLRRVTEAASRFDPSVMLQKYTAVYQEIFNEMRQQ